MDPSTTQLYAWLLLVEGLKCCELLPGTDMLQTLACTIWIWLRSFMVLPFMDVPKPLIMAFKSSFSIIVTCQSWPSLILPWLILVVLTTAHLLTQQFAVLTGGQ